MSRDTSNFEADLKMLREESQKAERSKIQLETQKSEATKRKAQYEEECTALGVKPLELDTEIGKLDEQIAGTIAELKAKLPQGAEAASDSGDEQPF